MEIEALLAETVGLLSRGDYAAALELCDAGLVDGHLDGPDSVGWLLLQRGICCRGMDDEGAALATFHSYFRRYAQDERAGGPTIAITVQLVSMLADRKPATARTLLRTAMVGTRAYRQARSQRLENRDELLCWTMEALFAAMQADRLVVDWVRPALRRLVSRLSSADLPLDPERYDDIVRCAYLIAAVLGGNGLGNAAALMIRALGRAAYATDLALAAQLLYVAGERGFDAGDFEEAIRLLRQCRDLNRALAVDDRGDPVEDSRSADLRQADAAYRIGLAADRLGYMVLSRLSSIRAIDLRRRWLPPDDLGLLHSRYEFAELQRITDRARSADVEFAEIVEALEPRLAVGDPAVVGLAEIVLKNAAVTAADLGLRDRARDYYRRGLAIAVSDDVIRQMRRGLERLDDLEDDETADEGAVGGVVAEVTAPLVQPSAVVETGDGTGGETGDGWQAVQARRWQARDQADEVADPEAARRAYEAQLAESGDGRNWEAVTGRFGCRLGLATILADPDRADSDWDASVEQLAAAQEESEALEAMKLHASSAYDLPDGAGYQTLALGANLLLRRLGDQRLAALVARASTCLKGVLPEFVAIQRLAAAYAGEAGRARLEGARQLRIKLAAGADDSRSRWDLRVAEYDISALVPPGLIDDIFDRSSFEAVHEALPDGTRLIDLVLVPGVSRWVRGETWLRRTSWYLGLVLDATLPGGIRAVDLGAAEPIHELATELGAAVQTEGTAWHRPARELYDALWSPLGLAPDPDGCDLVCPSPSLSRCYFDVLLDEHLVPVLCKHQIALVGSARDLTRLDNALRDTVSAPVVLAGPDYSGPGSFRPLPMAAVEGQAVSELLGVEPVLAGAATRAFALGMSEPELLHVAGHAFYAETADAAVEEVATLMSAGLALAGVNRDRTQVLTALDVLTVDLHSTDHVVLSACGTGVGPTHLQEGSLGLARAFVLAGCGSVLWSRGPVSDALTMSMMVDYYRRLLFGFPRAAALAETKRHYLQVFPDRVDVWSAFALQGRSGPLLRFQVEPTTVRTVGLARPADDGPVTAEELAGLRDAPDNLDIGLVSEGSPDTFGLENPLVVTEDSPYANARLNVAAAQVARRDGKAMSAFSMSALAVNGFAALGLPSYALAASLEDLARCFLEGYSLSEGVLPELGSREDALSLAMSVREQVPYWLPGDGASSPLVRGSAGQPPAGETPWVAIPTTPTTTSTSPENSHQG